MGAPEWITDERSKTKTNRSVHRDWLNAEIEKRLMRNTSDYWIETLNEAGVACGRINNLKEVFEEPQVKHLGILKKVTSKHLGEQTLMGQPVTLTRTPPRSCARRRSGRAHGGNPLRDRLRPRRPLTHESRRSLLMGAVNGKHPSLLHRAREDVARRARAAHPFQQSGQAQRARWTCGKRVPLLLEQAEKDDSVRMVVFSGEGDKAFVSGADISQFDDLRAARKR